MLWLTIPDVEAFDQETNEFVILKGATIQLEHSLVSMSKWESKWKKPLLKNGSCETFDEIIDYIRCMTITQNVKPDVYKNITDKNIRVVNSYMDDPMTATTFNTYKTTSSKLDNQRYTSELIYYWMISYNIPFECQKWHLNRLLTLIRVCSIKNGGGNKMSKSEVMSNNKALNEARKKQYKTKG